MIRSLSLIAGLLAAITFTTAAAQDASTIKKKADAAAAARAAGVDTMDGAAGANPLPNHASVEKLMKQADANGDGQLTGEEVLNFRTGMMKLFGDAAGLGPQMQAFLKQFDMNGDGQLSDLEKAAAFVAFQRLMGGARHHGVRTPYGAGNLGLNGYGGGTGYPGGAMPGGGYGGGLPGAGFGGGDVEPPKRSRAKEAMIKKYDLNGDGELNAEEKAAARKGMEEARGIKRKEPAKGKKPEKKVAKDDEKIPEEKAADK